MKKLLTVFVLYATISHHCLIASSYSNSSSSYGNEYYTPGLLQIMVKYGHNPDGIPALHYAIKMKDEEAVRLLLEHGADPNASVGRDWDADEDAPVSALGFAAAYGNANLIRLIVGHGAYVNPPPKRNAYYSPLQLAAKYDNAETICALVECGANPYEVNGRREEAPIHIAAQYCSVKAMKALLKMGSRVNVYTNSGSTPLHIALDLPRRGIVNIDVIRLLLEWGADPNLAQLQSGIPTALFFARTREAVILLFEYGVNVSATDRKDKTALHHAVNVWDTGHANESPNWYINVINALIQIGININARDAQGNTALSIASPVGWERHTLADRTKEIRNLLIHHG